MVQYTVTEQQPQSQSSVEVQRYKDGTYGWTIKEYEDSPLPDINGIKLYDDQMKARFVAKPAELADQLEASITAKRDEEAPAYGSHVPTRGKDGAE